MAHDLRQPDLWGLVEEPEALAIPRRARRLCDGTCCECGKPHACGACLGGEQLTICARGDDGRPRLFELPE